MYVDILVALVALAQETRSCTAVHRRQLQSPAAPAAVDLAAVAILATAVQPQRAYYRRFPISPPEIRIGESAPPSAKLVAKDDAFDLRKVCEEVRRRKGAATRG